jgi:hypothetical protein
VSCPLTDSEGSNHLFCGGLLFDKYAITAATASGIHQPQNATIASLASSGGIGSVEVNAPKAK